MDNGPTQNASALLTLWTNWNLDLNVVDRALVRIIASKWKKQNMFLFLEEDNCHNQFSKHVEFKANAGRTLGKEYRMQPKRGGGDTSLHEKGKQKCWNKGIESKV